jgi:hypothetical protein
VLNRTGNRLVAALLRTPALHRLASHRLALISVTGRRTGLEHTFPIAYRRRGSDVKIGVEWAGRKLWWRNLRGDGAPIRIRLQNQLWDARAKAVGTPDSGVQIEVTLIGRLSR